MLVPPKSVSFEGKVNKQKEAELEVFGRELADGEYVKLAGVCIPDLNVTVVFYPEAYNGFPIQVKARAEQKGVFSVVFLVKKDVMVLESMFNSQKGKAWETFYHLAKKAAALGLKKIEGKALRYPVSSLQGFHDGYKKVLRWGFNGTVPAQVTAALEGDLKAKKTLHELGESKEGRDAWAEHGTTIIVEFDLAPGSQAWQLLGKPPGVEPEQAIE